MSCLFRNAWVGECKNETMDGEDFCEEHLQKQCVSCGEQATHECHETMGPLVCGSPLCNECEHTIRENGCNSGAQLPEDLNDHCRKDEQVYKPWYM